MPFLLHGNGKNRAYEEESCAKAKSDPRARAATRPVIENRCPCSAEMLRTNRRASEYAYVTDVAAISPGGGLLPSVAAVFRERFVSSYCTVTRWPRSICENGNDAETVPWMTRSVYAGPARDAVRTSRKAETEMSG